MAGTRQSGQGGLLPDRHQQMDFFVCDVLGAIPKDDIATMEHPVFSLSTRPDQRILTYDHNGYTVQVVPSVKGLATIYDKDILIFCISQLMAGINAGREVSRTLTLKVHDLLVAVNRETSGDAYRRLREAFERLSGTRITTNIETGGVEVTSGFGLIESWEIVRRTRGGRMLAVTVTLSDWLFRAVLSKSVLTLSRNYFRLRKPLERRIYELARKHCGGQASWRVSVGTLLKKSGSSSPKRVFRKMLRDMIASGHLPDYSMVEEPDDIIRFDRIRRVKRDFGHTPILSGDAIEEAKLIAPGLDIYAIQAEWLEYWVSSGRPKLLSADKAFLGFVKVKARS